MSDDKTGQAYQSEAVEAFAGNMARLMEESGKAVAAYLKPRETGEIKGGMSDEVVDVVKTLGQVAERWMGDPDRAVEAQRRFTEGFVSLWASTLKRMQGEEAEPVIEPDPKDNRFKDPEWRENPYFDFLKQAYLHTTRWAEGLVKETDDIDPHTRHKAEFYVRQIAHAVSPSNFVLTNPELLRETMAQKGENLVRGMKMLAEDVEEGRGYLKIRQADNTKFKVGENLATTPGKVIFRNELMELIQYSPTTEKARKRPVVIVPPWINKFYILDLNPDKSFIRWAVSQELTVFVISWVNPGPELAGKSFEDYMNDGILKAVDIANGVCRTKDVDLVGYCVGGTLLAVTLAYMAARQDKRAASATFLTTQVDFTHAGDLKVFVDEEQLKVIEQRMKETGYLAGRSMASAFNMLRPHDLIWPYFVNNYLRGKEPTAFDLLYWNSDSTRMPAANHAFYLRNCYLNNTLTRGKMALGETPLDLRKVTVPVYNLATREDHIAPAKSVFLGCRYFGGPVRFVLAGSGHIAGVVNPAGKPKYQFWLSDQKPEGELESWIEKAVEHPGSWWPDWRQWLEGMDASRVKARTPGSGRYKALCDAPGTYVLVRD